MLKKELVKEKWLSFEEGENLNEEMPNIELGRLVFESIKHRRMYNAPYNEYIEKRIEELSIFKREVENIKNISIIRGANVNCDYDLNNTYLIIEDKYGPNVVLELNSGWDESYRFRELFCTKKVKIECLYKSKKDSEPMQLSEIKKVVYYPKATLINSYNKVEITKEYILEIVDNLNNKLYVDCFNNNLFYGSNKYKLMNNTKKIKLFSSDLSTNVPEHILDFKHYLAKTFLNNY